MMTPTIAMSTPEGTANRIEISAKNGTGSASGEELISAPANAGKANKLSRVQQYPAIKDRKTPARTNNLDPAFRLRMVRTKQTNATPISTQRTKSMRSELEIMNFFAKNEIYSHAKSESLFSSDMQAISEQRKLILRRITRVWRVIEVQGVNQSPMMNQKRLVIDQDGIHLLVLKEKL